jgi:polyhydroxyalkanoate synthase
MTAALRDWWQHLATSPAKQFELWSSAATRLLPGALAALGGATVIEPAPQDRRFGDPAWQAPPFHALAQIFLLQQQWWQQATTGVPGVTRHDEQMASFAARQWLDVFAPSNFVLTNPVVRQRTLSEGGGNLLRGLAHVTEDLWREWLDAPPAGADAFEPGRNVAVTPGCVVLRNRLMELIQYAPSTPRVHAEPVLLVPAWIMKYYVLDLSPHNSLIKYLVDQGFTVFVISWKNPQAQDHDLGMDDYARLGVLDALQAVRAIVPGHRVHACGYCLGGTLLASVAALLGGQDDTPLASLTLLAAQTDFTEPGELALFIDEDQVTALEQRMQAQGYLDKAQMKRTFQLLRSNDLVWSYRVHALLLGERAAMSDLMAWNADGTRLPARMHAQYLRGFYLDNALARGEWQVEGRTVNLMDIRVPVFSVATLQDHVAPWRSVYRLQSLCDADQTFVLTGGGHNVGIVNPPGDRRSSYQLRHQAAGTPRLAADDWLADTPVSAGSWWTTWVAWLGQHSGRRRVAPPTMGGAARGEVTLDAAPGHYVYQR